MKRVFAQTRKELIQIARDRLALVLALVLPLFLLWLLSTAIALTVNDVSILVRDFDDSPASRSYIDAFRNSVTFKVKPWPPHRNPEEALLAGAARAVVTIPEKFERDVQRGYAPEVQVLVDGTDANTAQLIQGYVSQITRAYSQAQAGYRSPGLVSADIRLWFNPGRDSPRFYAPGIYVLGISLFPPLLAALAMSKEGEQKTILQVYVSSISAHEFLLGKIIAFTLIGLAEAALQMVVLFTAFGFSLAGDPTPLLVATVLYTFTVAAFGTMVGAAIPSQAAAVQAISVGGFLLVFLLSGLIFPVENIPGGLKWISNLVWARYYIPIVRDALLQGGGWPAMWFNVAMVSLIGSVFYLVAWNKMRRMQVAA